MIARTWLGLRLLGILFIGVTVSPRLAGAGPQAVQAEVHFARDEDIDPIILEQLAAVVQSSDPHRSICLLMYSLTDEKIADELIQASQAGVTVLVVMDASEASTRGSQAPRLLQALGDHAVLCHGLPRAGGTSFGIMHEKMAVLSTNVVILGSYNWTSAARHYNWENLLLLASPEIRASCQLQFNEVWQYAHDNPTGPISSY